MDFYWIAHYIDGSKLEQFENEEENKYTDIRRDYLKAFALCQVNTGVPQVVIYFDRPSQRLIYRRRVQNDFNLRQGTLTPRQIIHMVGWQEKVGERNVQCLLFLYPNGMVCAMPRFQQHADFMVRDFNLEDKLDGISK